MDASSRSITASLTVSTSWVSLSWLLAFLAACLLFLSLRLRCEVRPYSCHIHQLSSVLRHCSRKLDAFLSILPVCFCALHGAEKRPAHNQSSDFPTASIAGTRWAHGC